MPCASPGKRAAGPWTVAQPRLDKDKKGSRFNSHTTGKSVSNTANIAFLQVFFPVSCVIFGTLQREEKALDLEPQRNLALDPKQPNTTSREKKANYNALGAFFHTSNLGFAHEVEKPIPAAGE